MRINIYSLFGAALTLLGLFLPWVSCSFICGYKTQLTVGSYTLSPSKGGSHASIYDLRNVTLIHYESHEEWMLPQRITFYWSWPPMQTYMFLSLLSYLLLAYSLSLAMLCSFASGAWAGQGRRFLKAATAILGVSIALWLYTVLALLNVPDQLGANQIYVNIGFYVSFAGAVLILISGIRPRFVKISGVNEIKSDGRLGHWLEISDREKSAAIILSSLVPTIVFAFFSFILVSLV